MKKKGFTLIELMIVIAIIAVLTGIVLASLSSARAKSRDARRVSDVKQLQLAVENYFDNNSKFPASLYGDDDFKAILPTVPTDPNGPQYFYKTNTKQNQYCIGTNLELANGSISSASCSITDGGAWTPSDPTPTNPYIVTGP